MANPTIFVERPFVTGRLTGSTMNESLILNGSLLFPSQQNDVVVSMSANVTAPQWMVNFIEFRKRLFLRTVEPIIVALLGPVVPENDHSPRIVAASVATDGMENIPHWPVDAEHRRLTFDFMPNYVDDPYFYRETSMSFATLMMLFVLMSCILVVFLSCFYHNQKTSPLFISPRRHRLPKLVPPPLPIDGYFDWVSQWYRKLFNDARY